MEKKNENGTEVYPQVTSYILTIVVRTSNLIAQSQEREDSSSD